MLLKILKIIQKTPKKSLIFPKSLELLDINLSKNYINLEKIKSLLKQKYKKSSINQALSYQNLLLFYES